MRQFLTKQEYIEIDECKCGGPVFKYYDSTKNIKVIKCGYIKHKIEINKHTKRKKWVVCKNQPCDWKAAYHGSRPTYTEPPKKLSTIVPIQMENKDTLLEKKLSRMFQYLLVSTRPTTIQEIDLVVKNNLHREPRKVYYFPSDMGHMRISHYESYEDYHIRIFSEKIVDRDFVPPTPRLPLSEKKMNIFSDTLENIELSSQFIVGDVASEHNSDDDLQRGESDFESVIDCEEVLSENENGSDCDY